MNKSELIKNFENRLNTIFKHHLKVTSNEIATKSINIFFESIKNALIAKDKVEIRGFGSFCIKNYKSYSGRNPKTGEKVIVQPKVLPVFRTGKTLKENINH